jgi:hypothetical protein
MWVVEMVETQALLVVQEDKEELEAKEVLEL